MFDFLKKKNLIAATISVFCIILLIFAVKKNGNNSKINSELGEAEESSINDKQLLSYNKKPFSWNQKLKPDGALYDFDLFTPPSVYLQDGKIITKTYDMLIIDDALPLYLSEISPKPYRLKIEGYSRSKDDNKVFIMFRDIETGKYCECSINGKCEDLKFQVREFELQGYEKDGVYYEVPMAKVYDETIKKEIVLTNEQKFLDGKFIVKIKDINGQEYVLRDIGSSVQIGEATCTLRSFNKKDGMAKLLLKDAQGQEFHKTIHIIR